MSVPLHRAPTAERVRTPPADQHLHTGTSVGPGETHGRGAIVTRALRRDLAALLHQQCWCWGRDIHYPCGNLLITHGAVRVPPPDGRRDASSAYQLTCPDGTSLSLWGFGIAIVPMEGPAVFLGRYVPLPQAFRTHGRQGMRQVWTPAELPARTCSDTPPAWWSLLKALRWVADYERWVLRTAGPSWRDGCTEDWEAAVVAGRLMAERWHALVVQLEARILQAAVPARPALSHSALPDRARTRRDTAARRVV